MGRRRAVKGGAMSGRNRFFLEDCCFQICGTCCCTFCACCPPCPDPCAVPPREATPMQKWQRILMGVGAGLFALSIGVLSPVFWLKPLQVIIGGLLIFAAHRPNQVALSATVLYFVGLSVV